MFLPAILLASILTGCVRHSTCTIAFWSAIHQGPSAGLSLAGNLDLRAAESGRLSGVLVREDGSEIPVTGQVDRQAIYLVLEWEEKIFFGVGALQNDLSVCQGVGGGSLTGPQPGDSGDWSVTLTKGEQPNTVSFNLVFVLASVLLLVVMGLGFLIISRRIVAPPPLQTAPWVTASSKTVEPEAWPGETLKPIVQFLTTYMLGDNRYDVSFSIDAGGNFYGECGAAISHATQTDRNKHVKAIEVWMFDKEDIRTVTQVLVSEYAFGDEALQARLSRKGQVAVIRPGEDVVLETKSLRLRAHVVEVNYVPGGETTASKSVFGQVTLKLGVWRKPQ